MRSKVNTKSLLGRSALIGILQESQKGSPTKSGDGALVDEEQQRRMLGEGEAAKSKEGNGYFSFNNNIYNNF